MNIASFKLKIIFTLLFPALFYPQGFAGVYIKNSVVKVGTLKYNEKRKLENWIINESNEPLKIKNIMKACACADIKLSSHDIPANGKAKITMTLTTGTLKGAFRKNIYFVTDRDKPKYLSLTISGTAEPFYTVTPSEFIYLGKIKTGEEIKRTINVKTADKTVWDKPTVTPTGAATVTIKATEENTHQLEIAINPQSPTPAFRVKISLPIKSPEKIPPLNIILSGSVVEK